MLRRFREWLTRELRDELEYAKTLAKNCHEEACALRVENERARALIRALRDVNADLDRRLVNGEN